MRSFPANLLPACPLYPQVSQYLGPNIVCGIVYLLSEVVKERPSLQRSLSALHSPCTTNDEDDLEVYPDAEDVDVEVGEEEEDEKKDEDEEIVSDIKEEEETVSDVKEEEDDDDEEENYSDDEIQEIKEEDESENEKSEEKFNTTTDTKPPLSTTSSWHHLLNPVGGKGGPLLQGRGEYDPLHRNPLFCGAQFSSFWELGYLKVRGGTPF